MAPKMRLMLATVLVIVWLAAPALAQYSSSSSRNGVYGGYVGSDRWFKSQTQSAQQRATMQRNLNRQRTGGQKQNNPSNNNQGKSYNTQR